EDGIRDFHVTGVQTCALPIFKEDLPDGEIGVAQVSGICAAVVNVTDANHKTATIAASTYILQSSANGPIPIFYQPAGTGATHERSEERRVGKKVSARW